MRNTNNMLISIGVFVEFQSGDRVLIRLSHECLPRGSFQKLQPWKAGPFKILKKLGPNAYLLELLADIGLSPIFDVADLMAYHEPPVESKEKPPTVCIPSTVNPREEIEAILDDQIVSTRRGGY